jgi:Fic family protein
MFQFLNVLEDLTPVQMAQIKKLGAFVEQIRLIHAVKSPSNRVDRAFEYMKTLIASKNDLSVDSILHFHKLIGEDGILRGPIEAFWSENNIAIRDYEPAPSEALPYLLTEYCSKYSLSRTCKEPILKIGGAYLAFELIHPFKNGNGRVGRLIAAWLMYAHGYEILAPYLEHWLGNENRSHGRAFESHIRYYVAWDNGPEFSAYAKRFLELFLLELMGMCQEVLQEKCDAQ